MPVKSPIEVFFENCQQVFRKLYDLSPLKSHFRWINLRVALICIFPIILYAIITWSSNGVSSIFIYKDPPNVTEKFQLNAYYPSTDPPPFGINTFGSLLPNNGISRYYTGFFKAESTLRLFVAGYPNAKNMSIVVKRVDDHRAVRLGFRDDPHEHWVGSTWKLPEEFVGQYVQVIADDLNPQLEIWMAISEPVPDYIKMSLNNTEVSWHQVIWRFVVFAVLLFLTPIGFLIVRKKSIRSVSDACLFFFIFWFVAAWFGLILIYFFPLLHLFIGPTIVTLSIALLIIHRNKFIKYLKSYAGIEYLKLLAIWLLASILALSLGFEFGGMDSPLGTAAHRFTIWAADNELPYAAAEKLRNGEPLYHWLFHSLAKDRPPLQAALVLLLYPFGTSKLDYQILGSLFQAFALLGLWLVFRSFRFPHKHIMGALALVAASGFCLVNIFYVWPKFLAAGFFFAALSIILKLKKKAASSKQSILIGILTSASLLSHGGAIFAFLGIIVTFLLFRYSLSLKLVFLSIISFVLGMLPWNLYVKYVDPPGNHLMKWHFAGVANIDSRTFLETFIDSYKSTPSSKLIENKLVNFKTLLGLDSFRQISEGMEESISSGAKAIWDSQFFFLFPACIPLIFVIFLGSGIKRKHLRSSFCFIGLSVIVSLILWCIIMFGELINGGDAAIGAFTFLHHGSSSIPLLIIAALAHYLPNLKTGIAKIIIVLHFLILCTYFFIAKQGAAANSILNSMPPLYAPYITAWISIFFLFLISQELLFNHSSNEKKL